MYTPRIVALRLLMWIAMHLIESSINEDERETLDRIRTSLSTMSGED